MLSILMKTRVATRIAMALAIPLLFLLGMGGWSLRVSDNTLEDMLDVRHHRLDAAVLALRMQQNVIQIQQWLTDISATRGLDGLDDGYQEAEEQYQAFVTSLAGMEKLLVDQTGTLRVLRERVDAYYAMGKRMAAAYIAEGPAAGNRIMGEFDKEAEALQEVLLPFVEEQRQTVYTHVDESIDMITLFKKGLIILLVLSLTISMAAVWVIARSILAQLGGEPARIAGFMERLAQGDLTVHLAGDARGLMASVHRLQQGLLDTVHTITIQSDTNMAVTHELIAVRQSLSSDAANSLHLAEQVLAENSALHQETNAVSIKAVEASDDVETAAHAVRSMEDNIRAMAAGAEQASRNMASVASSAEEMSTNVAMVNQSIGMVDDSVSVVAAAVEEMTASLAEVQSRCQRAAQESTRVAGRMSANEQVMNDLESSIQEIGKVVSTIKNIADQTNLLALNAAIEAAGAGEAGMGFAVVANEVKELARRTSDATRTIASMIEKTRDNSHRVTDSFRQMSESIATIDQNNQEINQAVSEQGHAVTEIARSMESVRSATRDVSRQAGEIAGSAQEVSRLVQEGAKGTNVIAQAVGEASGHAAEVASCSAGALYKTNEVRQLAAHVLANAAEVQKKTLKMLHLASYANGSAHHTGQLAEVIVETSEALRQSVSHLQTGQAHFDLARLKEVHLAWLGTLENVVWGKVVIRPDEVTDHHACALGQWYDQEGQRLFGKLPVFSRLGEAHSRVHALAREVVTLLDQGGGPPMTGDDSGFEDFSREETRDGQHHLRLRQEALNKIEQFNHLRKELFTLMDQLAVASHG